MTRTLLVAFQPSDAPALAGFARAMGHPYDLLCLTGQSPTDTGAERLMQTDLAELPSAEVLTRALEGLAGGYSHIAGISSMAAKDGLARLAGQLDAAMVTDALAVVSPTVFIRPMVAGALVATVEVLAVPVVLTVRPAGFEKVSGEPAAEPESVTFPDGESTRRIEVAAKQGGRPDLTQARVVVSGGRPLRDAETFDRLIGGLADRLGGAAGATRAAVDSGIAPNELQVGQTGKVVAPDLYIAAGISGSTQHMAGIKDSKWIVAINKDADAPIFEVADLGLVGDLFEVIPELLKRL